MESNIDESRRLVRCLMQLVKDRIDKIEHELEEQKKAKDSIYQLIDMIEKSMRDANMDRYINERVVPVKRRHSSDLITVIGEEREDDSESMHKIAVQLKDRMKRIEANMEQSIADIDVLACRLAEVDFRIKYAS